MADMQLMNVTPRQVRLYLLGAGVAFPDHLTVQTIDILTACARICTILPDSRLITLPADIREKCISFWPLYQDGRCRSENYRDVTNAVLSEVKQVHQAAWLTPGHPMVFDSVSKALLDTSASRQWNVSVIPAISCLDTLLAEVAYDPANGLVVQDATGLIRREIPLVTSNALILLQISVFLSDRVHISLTQGAIDLTPLRDYLIKYFPAMHPCAVVRSSDLTMPSQITWIQLSDLPSVPIDVFAGATLFVPPVEKAIG